MFMPAERKEESTGGRIGRVKILSLSSLWNNGYGERS